MAEDLTILMILEAQDRATAQLGAMQAKLDSLNGTMSGGKKSADELGKAHDELGNRSERMGQRVGSVFEKLGNEANNWGIPFGNVLTDVGKKLDRVGTTGSSSFDKLAGAGKVASVAVIAGFIGATGAAIHFADEQDKAAGQVAVSAGVSTDAAKSIGDSFTKVGSDLRFNATQMTTAYASVAGQLGSVEGHALSVSEADKVMAASADLAAAKHIDLASATGAVGKVMQEFNLPASQANAVTTDLLNTSNSMGISVAAAAQQIQRMGSQMGYAKGTAGDLSAFMVDLANHGETGRGAMSAAQASITQLLKTTGGPDSKAASAAQAKLATATADVEKAQKNLADTQARLGAKGQLTAANQLALANAQDKVNTAIDKYGPGSAQAIAAQQKLAMLQATDAAKANLSVANQQSLQKAQDAVTAALTKQTDAQKAATDAGAPANAAAKAMGLTLYDAKGNFVGMGSVIDQLQPKLKGLTKAQADAYLQNLLGTQATRKMLDTIEAGPAAWNKAEAAVTSGQTAHEAAAKATANLDDEAGALGKDVHNLGIEYGEWLTPKLAEAAKVGGDLLGFFEHNKTAALALAGVIGGALTLAIGAFAYKTVKGVVGDIGNMFGDANKLKDKLLGGDESLAGEGETASNSLDSAATKLSEAASQLDAAAQKLSTAGAQTAEEMKTGAATAATDLEAGGAETATDMKLGATESAAALETGGVETATDLKVGAGEAAAELDAAGAETATELRAGAIGPGGAGGGGPGGEGEGGPMFGGGNVGLGGAAMGAAMGAPIGIQVGHSVVNKITGMAASQVPAMISPEKAIFDKAMASNDASPGGAIEKALGQLSSAGMQIQADAAKLGMSPTNYNQRVQLNAADDTLYSWWQQLYAHGESIKHPGQPVSVPGADNGGIVTGPTLAGLALNSRPEAIIPLSDIGRYLPNMNVNAMAGGGTAPVSSANEGRTVTIGEINLLTVPMTPQEAASAIAWSVKKV